MNWKKITRISIYFFLTIFVLTGIFILYTLYLAGSFKSIQSHFAGKSEQIKTKPAGAEDITLYREEGIAFVSCQDRRNTQEKGAILLLDVKKNKPEFINLTEQLEQNFHPHGIAFYQAADGEKRLFVINHTSETQSSVEIFRYSDKKLIHLESIEDTTLMTSPNDIIAVGKRQFYVTNDHGKVKGFSRQLEDYLRLPYAYVNFYDGKKIQKVAEGINYANGINISNNGKTLFVASTTGRKILVYDRNLANNQLKHKGSLHLATGVDNIELDENENLWIACHPQLLAFINHGKNAENKSPSQVIKIDKQVWENLIHNKEEEIFLNDGKQLSGSSVAAVFGNRLLIGSVYEPHILWCTLEK